MNNVIELEDLETLLRTCPGPGEESAESRLAA